MERQVVWVKGSRHKVKADDAFQEIERVRDLAGGIVSPQKLVDASRPAEAVLHPEFEWDDTVAANEFRKDQARQIVQTLEVVTANGGIEQRVPALVSVIVEGRRGYQPTAVAFEDADSADFVLHEALTALAAWQRRYQALRQHEKMSEVWAAVDSIMGGANRGASLHG